MTIRTEGVYKLDKIKSVAWLTIEVPPIKGKGGVEVESFQSIHCMIDNEAEENVSEFAIAHFISNMNVSVNDVNHASIMETYR